MLSRESPGESLSLRRAQQSECYFCSNNNNNHYYYCYDHPTAATITMKLYQCLSVRKQGTLSPVVQSGRAFLICCRRLHLCELARHRKEAHTAEATMVKFHCAYLEYNYWRVAGYTAAPIHPYEELRINRTSRTLEHRRMDSRSPTQTQRGGESVIHRNFACSGTSHETPLLPECGESNLLHSSQQSISGERNSAGELSPSLRTQAERPRRKHAS